MSEIEEKIQEYLDQGAIGALSGANKVREYVNQAKFHLISRFYDYICGCGDAEKARGIREMCVNVFGQKEWLEEPPVLFTKENVNATLGIAIDMKHQNRMDVYLDLEEGTYQVEVEMLLPETQAYGNDFNVSVSDKSGNHLAFGSRYAYDEKMGFSVEEFEPGVCKICFQVGKKVIENGIINLFKV
jgi:hypothetical protein